MDEQGDDMSDDPENQGTGDEPSSEDDYVGLSEAQAQVLAESQGVPFRVVYRDGEPLAVTMDFRPGRINATVSSGVVTSYEVEGEGMETDF